MEEFLPYHLSNATVNFSVLNFSESTSVKSHEENKSVSNHYIDTILYVTSSGSKVTFGYFVVCILSIILAGWMIFLNGLVIHALLNKKRHSEVTDYFVSSLSIADLVTGILLLYVTSYSLIQYQNQWECLFRFGLTYAVSQSSFTHILAITIDRYVKIIFPFRYFTLITKKTVIITSSTIWFFSIIIGLLPLLGWHKEYTSNKNGGTVCRFFGVLPDGYFILNFITSLITSLGMLSLYIHIIYIAIQQRNQMQTLTEGYDFTRNGHDDQAWRLVKTVAIIVLISNLCWLPGVVVIVLHITGNLDHMSYDMRGDLITFCGLAVFLNSLINPLIYAAKIDAVKARFVSVLCRQQAKRDRTPSQSDAMKTSEV